jgi:electron transport complex protein RnfG
MMNKESPLGMIVVLTLICVASALSLGFLYLATKEKIEGETKKVIEESLARVLPDADPQEFEKVDTKTKDGKAFVYYKAYDKEKNLIGYAATGKAKGYSSEIVVMIGVDNELKKFKGLKVLVQQETPGLGTQCQEEKVDKKLWAPMDDPGKPQCWTDQFAGKEIEGLKVVKEKNDKDIVAITGATITSKAVFNAACNDAMKNLREVLSGEAK